MIFFYRASNATTKHTFNIYYFINQQLFKFLVHMVLFCYQLFPTHITIKQKNYNHLIFRTKTNIICVVLKKKKIVCRD